MRALASALVATHLLAAGAGYWLAPKQPLDRKVEESGWFRTDATHVIATTVESLRAENRLLVFSYRGSARVEADRTAFWLFHGHQELIVPAAVGYYLDLSALSLADVTYNARARLVRVRLPVLTVGDVAFEPEGATTVNGGLLTYGQGTVEALGKLNYATARRAMVAQSQQPSLVDAARRQAVADVQGYFEIPLKIAGLPDVRVAATFG